MADKRLYVGNLSSDATEHDLLKFFKEYGVSAVELKRKSGPQDDTTFAYVNILADKVNDCLEQCRSKNFKNSSIKIEVARVSFLEKLKKERAERSEINSSGNKVLNPLPVSNVIRKNKKIVFSDDDNDNDDTSNHVVNDSHQTNVISSPKFCRNEKKKLIGSHSELRNEVDNSDDEVPRKRNLPMFQGTASVSFANEVESKIDISRSMKRFEEFSDVWRDSSPEKDSGPRKKLKWKLNESVIDSKEGENSSSESNTTRLKSKNVAECKRINALQKKWNVIREKKETIKKALKNIKSNRTNMIFPEPNEEENYASNTGNKLVLFEDDASDDDFQANFDAKEHLDGKDGLKLLKLKSKLSADERFKLSDRFYEDDEVPTMENSNRLTNEKELRKKLFQQRSMIRYDPAKADHKLIEKQLINKAVEKKSKTKKKTVKKKALEEKSEKSETPKPEVSKEQHYSVTDSLKNAFKKTDEKAAFSLSALFDDKIRKDKRTVDNINVEAVPIKKLNSIENPFENLSESEENDEVTIDEEPLNILPGPTSDEKVLGKCGVWGETFFFKPNDSRLKEAVSFYTISSKPKHTNYEKARCKLRSIVRKKLQNCRRDKKLFKQKLGGRLNKSKFQKRLKKASS